MENVNYCAASNPTYSQMNTVYTPMPTVTTTTEPEKAPLSWSSWQSILGATRELLSETSGRTKEGKYKNKTKISSETKALAEELLQTLLFKADEAIQDSKLTGKQYEY